MPPAWAPSQRARPAQIAAVKDAKREGASLRFDIDESPGAPPVATQLREALNKNGVRVIDMFHDWDGPSREPNRYAPNRVASLHRAHVYTGCRSQTMAAVR